MEKTTQRGLIKKDDAVIVVIDEQEKLLPVISNREEVIANTLKLIQCAGILKIPVLFTEQEKLGPTVPEIATQKKELPVIEKTHFNCFYNETFQKTIDRLGKKTIILTGVEAHICVAQTAVYGVEKHNVHVVSDAIGSRKDENRAVALERMRQSGAIISSTEMAIYEMLEKAGTQEFKSVLHLVK